MRKCHIKLLDKPIVAQIGVDTLSSEYEANDVKCGIPSDRPPAISSYEDAADSASGSHRIAIIPRHHKLFQIRASPLGLAVSLYHMFSDFHTVFRHRILIVSDTDTVQSDTVCRYGIPTPNPIRYSDTGLPYFDTVFRYGIADTTLE